MATQSSSHVEYFHYAPPSPPSSSHEINTGQAVSRAGNTFLTGDKIAADCEYEHESSQSQSAQEHHENHVSSRHPASLAYYSHGTEPQHLIGDTGGAPPQVRWPAEASGWPTANQVALANALHCYNSRSLQSPNDLAWLPTNTTEDVSRWNRRALESKLEVPESASTCPAGIALNGRLSTLQEYVKWRSSEGVQCCVATGPPEDITDPSLLVEGMHASRYLPATSGNQEPLRTGYKKRERPRNFFKKGKVFLVLWSEPAGSFRSDSSEVTQGSFGEPVFSKVRRFVVIREGANYCSALSIATHGGRGVAGSGTTKFEHAIIYTGRVAPEPTYDEVPRRGEAGLRVHAIRVEPHEKTDKLDPMSRVNLAKIYTVEHYVKVKPFGEVHPQSLQHLEYQWRSVWMPQI